MDCDDFRGSLYGLLHDTLAEADKTGARTHVEACAECAESLRRARAQVGILQVVREIDPPGRSRWLGGFRESHHWYRVTTAALGTMILLLAGSFLILSYRGTSRTIEERFLRRLDQGIQLYRIRHGEYPASETRLLNALRSDDGIWRHLDIDDHAPPRIGRDGRLLDRWGRPIRYTVPGRIHPLFFDLVSSGSNGIDEAGGGDDVTN
ncbi:MAG: type II secretion system protein GspG [Planctomycetes bacterium]|nr:type II secretion system protein GspG [Planctomycetota bacterium]